MLIGREAAEIKEYLGKADVSGEHQLSCKRRKGGVFPGEEMGMAEASDLPGSMPIAFQARFGIVSPQRTGAADKPSNYHP